MIFSVNVFTFIGTMRVGNIHLYAPLQLLVCLTADLEQSYYT